MHPLVPALLGFIAGILLGDRATLSSALVISAFGLSLLLLLFLLFIRRRFYRPAVLLPFVFLGVLFIHPYSRPQLPAGHVKNLISQPVRSLYASQEDDVTATVISSVEETGGRTRLIVEAAYIIKGEARIETNGRMLLTVPDGAPEFLPGDIIRVTARLREPANFGNPGEYDYKGRLNNDGVFVTGSVRNKRLVVKLRDGTGGFRRSLDIVRHKLQRFIDANAINGGPLKSLIIAESAGIDAGLREAFAKTSTAHILAISGLHVGIVAFFAYWVILFLLKRSERLMLALNVKKAAMTLALGPVVLYGAVAGMPFSAVRAVVMVSVFTVSFACNRGKDMWNTLAFAALLILAINPSALREISFQLSFAAVAGIIYLVPALQRLAGVVAPAKEGEGGVMRVLRRRVLPALFVTIAASVGTAPIIAYHFHRVSFAGVAANLIVVPLTSLIVPLLLAASALSFVWEGLATAFLSCADGLFGALVGVVRVFAALPYASVWVTSPTLIEAGLFYGLVFCAVNIKRQRLCAYLAPVIIVAFAVDWGYWNYYARRTGELKVTFISVGQGDSALVEFPQGSTMLIDGGGFYNSGFDTGERIVAPLLWSKKIGRLDYVVLSHPQRDHMAGLKFITAVFEPKEFWYNGMGGLGELGRVLERGNTVVKTPRDLTGEVLIDGAVVTVLHPFNPGYDVNNSSLVLRVGYNGRGVLFTGDIGQSAEDDLLKKNVAADVLKVAHHGSRYSTSSGFLRAVKPKVAVISAGRANAFGFPNPDTLTRLEQEGVKVYRTDLDGAVTVSTDGQTLNVSTH